MTLTHRFAESADLPALVLNHALIRDEGDRNIMSVAALENRMRSWLCSCEYRVVLFEEDGATVGYALFSETATEVHLRHFFVIATRRRQGIGRVAWDQLTAAWPGKKRWTVSVLAGNRRALAFWRAMGYVDYDITLEILARG
jgi:GNAT superfamily N-acetyltransferase